MAWAPDYVTTTELKTFLSISDAVDDAQLAFAITAASRAVDRHCGRQFGVVSGVEQRFYTAHHDRDRSRWVVEIDDLMSTSGFVAEVQGSDGSSLGTISSYVLLDRNAAAQGRPWTALMVRPESTGIPTGLPDEVAVTALWGWTAVPVAVKQATLLQASRLVHRRTSPFGVAGSPELGSELRLLARVDPDVSVALSDYVRWWA